MYGPSPTYNTISITVGTLAMILTFYTKTGFSDRDQIVLKEVGTNAEILARFAIAIIQDYSKSSSPNQILDLQEAFSKLLRQMYRKGVT